MDQSDMRLPGQSTTPASSPLPPLIGANTLSPIPAVDITELLDSTISPAPRMHPLLDDSLNVSGIPSQPILAPDVDNSTSDRIRRRRTSVQEISMVALGEAPETSFKADTGAVEEQAPMMGLDVTSVLELKTSCSSPAQPANQELVMVPFTGNGSFHRVIPPCPAWLAGSEAAWDAFQTLDEDGSGELDMTEFGKLAQMLGLKLTKTQLRSAFKKLDVDAAQGEEKDGLIGFGSFCAWFNRQKEAQRRANRIFVMELFQSFDDDNSGALGIDEIARLVKKSKHKLSLVDPPFNLEEDWKLMTKTSTDEVTFHHFELWWKKRTGVSDADIPVLPESMMQKIAEVGLLQDRESRKKHFKAQTKMADITDAEKLTELNRNRSGEELWAFLRPRLRLIVTLQSEWGAIHELYASASESLFNETSVPDGIRHPDSNFSGKWDLLQIIMLMYVAITVPMRSCFDIEVDNLSFGFFLDVAVDIYFLLDFGLSFRTAYWDSNGILEVRKKRIVHHYLKGWFFIDLISCAPVQYVFMAVSQINAISDSLGQPTHAQIAAAGGDEDDGSYVRTLKAVRLVRMTKLLRLSRMLSMFKKYQEVLSSYMSIIAVLFGVFFLSHMLSCFFYLTGSYDQVLPTGHIIKGWVRRQEGWGNGGGGNEGWGGSGSREQPLVGTLYLTSLVFALSATDHCETDAEKGVAVISSLAVGVIFGAIAGVMTQIANMMQSNDQELSLKIQALRDWMHEQQIPKPTQAKVRDYFSELWMSKSCLNEAEIISQLPPAMQGEMSRLLYSEVITSVPVFRNLSYDIINALCSAVTPCIATKGQTLMCEGDPGEEMYLLISGEVEVTMKNSRQGQKDVRLGFLSNGAFFGEVPVLSDGRAGSQVRMRTVTAVTPCKLCFISRSTVVEISDRYTELQVRLLRFRRLGSKMNPKRRKRMMASIPPDERKKIKQKTRKHLRRASIRVQAQSFHPTRPGSRQPQPPPPDGNTPTGRKDMWDNSTVKPDDTSAAELSSIHSLLYEMKQAAAMEREALRTTMNELDTKVTSLQTAIFNISSKGG